jgi:hypothetical protein
MKLVLGSRLEFEGRLLLKLGLEDHHGVRVVMAGAIATELVIVLVWLLWLLGCGVAGSEAFETL